MVGPPKTRPSRLKRARFGEEHSIEQLYKEMFHPKADEDRAIDFGHPCCWQMANSLEETYPIQRADLKDENSRVPGESSLTSGYSDGKLALLRLGAGRYGS